MIETKTAEAPWYKDRWPWILMAAPGLAVVGGIAILLLAVATHDGLVVDDYYKQALAINQTLARDRAAAAGGYRAHIIFTPALDRVRVTLRGAAPSAALVLRLVHPTRSGYDRVVQLNVRSAGLYEGALSAPQPGRWGVTLEDMGGAWRLNGVWQVPGEPVLDLEPAEEGG